MLSVEADQERAICDVEIALAERLPGTVGGVISVAVEDAPLRATRVADQLSAGVSVAVAVVVCGVTAMKSPDCTQLEKPKHSRVPAPVSSRGVYAALSPLKCSSQELLLLVNHANTSVFAVLVVSAGLAAAVPLPCAVATPSTTAVTPR